MLVVAAVSSTSDRVVEILEAACRVVVREGAHGLRMAAVAAEAGVSKALVHYYFANRRGAPAGTRSRGRTSGGSPRSTRELRGATTGAEKVERALLMSIAPPGAVRRPPGALERGLEQPALRRRAAAAGRRVVSRLAEAAARRSSRRAVATARSPAPSTPTGAAWRLAATRRRDRLDALPRPACARRRPAPSCAPRFVRASSRVDRRPRPRCRPGRTRRGAGPRRRGHGRRRARGARAGRRPCRAASGGRPPAGAARRRGRRAGAHGLPRASSTSSGSRSSRATPACRGRRPTTSSRAWSAATTSSCATGEEQDGLRPRRARVGESSSTSVDPADPWAHPDAARLDGVSIGTWLRSVDALPSTIRRLEVGSLALADGSIERSSLLAELRKSAASASATFYSLRALGVAPGGRRERRGGGAAWRSELGERVRLDAEVASVRVDGACRVTLASGEELRAEAVVCALPAPVAARLEIDGRRSGPPALASALSATRWRRRWSPSTRARSGRTRARTACRRGSTYSPRRGRRPRASLGARASGAVRVPARADGRRPRRAGARLAGAAVRAGGGASRRRSTTGSGESTPTLAAT